MSEQKTSNNLVPHYAVRKFGEYINQKKSSMRGGYKKRGKK